MGSISIVTAKDENSQTQKLTPLIVRHNKQLHKKGPLSNFHSIDYS